MKAALFASLVSTVSAAGRYVVYFDQYHTTTLPTRAQTGGVTHVITAFANSSLFTTSPGGEYEPFKPLSEIRSLFDTNTKVCMAIGGWGDLDGFGIGAATASSRKLFAQNVAATVTRLGYDCVDIDWEYPGGNGEDYKQKPNSQKTFEIEAFPLFLAEIKAAIGSKELSIAVPGLERDMLGYTAATVPKINAAVDFVNVMAYDLMNRRDTATLHHSDIKGCMEAIKLYIARGIPAKKLNLGFAFYAKWFTTKPGVDCSQNPIGCPVVDLENSSDGSDTGKSGAQTFEASVFLPVPSDLSDSPDGSCGAGTGFQCSDGNCCSQYGSCGDSDAHCLTGCQFGYGNCLGSDINGSFKRALSNAINDKDRGAMWWWDPSEHLFWTWDDRNIITQKCAQIIARLGLGGAMAWSLAEDSHSWEHLLAIRDGVAKYIKA